MQTKEKILKNKGNLGITELKKTVSLKTLKIFIPQFDFRGIFIRVSIIIITAIIVIFSPH